MASLLRCECCEFEGETEFEITCEVGHVCQRNDFNCMSRNRNSVRRSFCHCCGEESRVIGEKCGIDHECKEGKCDNSQYYRSGGGSDGGGKASGKSSSTSTKSKSAAWSNLNSKKRKHGKSTKKKKEKTFKCKFAQCGCTKMFTQKKNATKHENFVCKYKNLNSSRSSGRGSNSTNFSNNSFSPVPNNMISNSTPQSQHRSSTPRNFLPIEEGQIRDQISTPGMRRPEKSSLLNCIEFENEKASLKTLKTILATTIEDDDLKNQIENLYETLFDNNGISKVNDDTIVSRSQLSQEKVEQELGSIVNILLNNPNIRAITNKRRKKHCIGKRIAKNSDLLGCTRATGNLCFEHMLRGKRAVRGMRGIARLVESGSGRAITESARARLGQSDLPIRGADC